MAARWLAIFIGLWLLLAPGVFGENARIPEAQRLVGFLSMVAAVLASFEVTRSVRWLHAGLGAVLLLLPLYAGTQPGAALVSEWGSGLVLIGCACSKGKIIRRYGGGWTALWK